MKERPIIFSGPMVRAILADEKTQTRRIVKPQPTEAPAGLLGDGERLRLLGPHGYDVRCPYGTYFDQLWVRESFYYNLAFKPSEGRHAPTTEEAREELYYRADCPAGGKPDFEGEESTMRWAPSIHMPRWASRITLEVRTIRVERLQSISEEDARAEGVERWLEESGGAFITLRRAYAALWDQINGEGAWEQNPWVWVVKFKRVQA